MRGTYLAGIRKESTTAQQGSPETLAAQQPGAPFRYIRIQPADRMEEEPASGVIVNEESGEICVYVDKSAKGVTTMTAIVAVYDKATGQFLDLWMGEIDPTDPLTGTGLIYDESKHYRIMVVDGDTWRIDPRGDGSFCIGESIGSKVWNTCIEIY